MKNKTVKAMSILFPKSLCSIPGNIVKAMKMRYWEKLQGRRQTISNYGFRNGYWKYYGTQGGSIKKIFYAWQDWGKLKTMGKVDKNKSL